MSHDIILRDLATMYGYPNAAKNAAQAMRDLIAQRAALVDALESMQMALMGYTHQNSMTRAALVKCEAVLDRCRPQVPSMREQIIDEHQTGLDS